MTESLPKILVIGGANLDIISTTFSEPVAGESNPGSVKSYAGGVGRNLAENLARLGFACHFISAIGNDSGHQLILESCQAAGINTDDLLVCPDYSTGTYLAVHNQNGALQFGVADMGILELLTPMALQKRRAALDAHDQLVLDGNLNPDTLDWIVANSEGKTRCVDAVSPAKAQRLTALLPHIDVLKVNREEAVAILDSNADNKTLAAALHERGVKNVLLSQGSEGAILHNQHGCTENRAMPVDCISDTGAGDALFAGFIAARQLFDEEARQLEFANACATATLGSHHPVCPTLSIDMIKADHLSHWNMEGNQ